MANLTVGKLKELIASLPDDMEIIIPVTSAEDSDYIESFRLVRTVGILSNKYEYDNVLYLGSSNKDLNIEDQLKLNILGTNCESVLF